MFELDMNGENMGDFVFYISIYLFEVYVLCRVLEKGKNTHESEGEGNNIISSKDGHTLWRKYVGLGT
jgi:hypothetical protein